ncbi:MAG TPA: SRPBCC family protein [Polyangiaceae bacterium]|nr:SRPBCC family protein [Polyangiaceae bacterium]
MAGHTENTIVVLRDYETVLDVSNRVELWPVLFTEYSKAEVLERVGDEILFRLTTHPEDGRPARTWTSRRKVDRAAGVATAERLDPTFPFAYMKIRWVYERLPKEVGVVMTWIQDFEVHADCPWSEERMESFLNRNTRVQMASVKRGLESWSGKEQSHVG